MVGAHEFRRAVFGEVVQPGAQHVANNVRIGKAVVDLQRKAFGQIARAHAARRQLLDELEQPLAVLYRTPCFGTERMHAAGKVPIVVDVLDEGVKQSAILFADAHARQLHAHMAVQRFRLRVLVAQTGQVEPAGIPSDRRRRARIEPPGRGRTRPSARPAATAPRGLGWPWERNAAWSAPRRWSAPPCARLGSDNPTCNPLAATRFGRFPSAAARFHRRAVLMLSF